MRDSSGAAIPGATVTAVMTEQQTTRNGQTDGQSFYSFNALPTRTYTLTFEANGFGRQVHNGVGLTVSQNARVDAQLAVGTVQNEVQVTGTAPLVDTTSNTLSGLVDDRRVADLPLNGRNVMSLAGILPGVTNVSAPQTQGDARGGQEMNVNGGLPNSAAYLYDGAFFNNASRNTGINMPPPDAVAQFRMLTSNFPAEYGHNSGAQVEVVSRSGTDTFHGAAWEFFRNVNTVANSLLGGWTISAIQTVESGLPVKVYAGQDVAVDGTGSYPGQYGQFVSGARPGNVKISHPNRKAAVNQFFNTAAFENPNDTPLGTYGNSSKGVVRGPAYADTDAALLKDFALPEKFRLHFRAESFNTFNQVNFSTPNSYANAGSAFGQIQSTVAGTGRQLQLALKLLW